MIAFLLGIIVMFYTISIVIGFIAGIINGIKDLPANDTTNDKINLTKG